MSVQDAAFLHIEDDVTPMHVGGVAIFEGPAPSHELLTSRIEANLALVPRYRQRVQLLPLNLGLPLWVDDQHFTLEYHLRRTAVPAPGGERELHRLVGRIISQHLDRARPLWEMWAVEGLEDGRWAIVSKVHHCMVDGVAATDLMSVLFESARDSRPAEVQPWEPEGGPGVLEVGRQSLAGALRPLGSLRSIRATISAPGQALRDASQLVQASQPFVRLLRPAPRTSLNGPFSPHRRWMVARAPLEDLKQVSRSTGATLNDAVLAAIAGGFRDLLTARGEPLDGRVVRTLVPVSVRAETERGKLDNRVSAVFVDLPVGLDDPIARLTDIRRQMDGLKQSHGAVAGERLVQLAGFAPPMLAALSARLATRVPQYTINTATTNVPGPQHPLYFAGCRLLESSPLIPLVASVRIVVGIFSYDGALTVGVTGDYDHAPDIDVLCHGIEAGIAALREASTKGSDK
ncbi:MAG TPA: wax ester/triacylglycerol synthase family O-acyltransferase [Euzebya sp.]|nr:wax ester/triacylglycerol synthase family O-acyltransferase [Euzebya sp.]